ncbi:shikimate kinase [Microbacterium paulum]
MRIVVTGPAEAATPLVAAALAAHLRARFLDTGELYPARVRPGGPPLGEIWLEALALAFTRERSLVASSGSLTRLRRDEIRARVPGVVFVELVVDDDAAPTRRSPWRRAKPVERPAVEPLGGDEPGVRVADDADLASIVDRIAQLLSGGVPGQSLR